MPWLAMFFSDEVTWTSTDFIVFALMLSAVCGGIELAVRLSSQRSYRLAAVMSLGGAFLMVWANLAVGIIGNEENPRNLILYVILAVGLIGAIISRGRALGLSLTLRVMAAVQIAVAVVAAVLDWALLPIFTVFYVALWVVAGQLFKISAKSMGESGYKSRIM